MLGKIGMALGFAMVTMILIVMISLLMGLPVMLLWNALLPALFGIKVIGFWQAVGINILCGILFKGTSHTSSN